MKEAKSIGVVILSRYGSRRLYGKALKQIEGKKVLEYIIERVNQVYPWENIVLATSEEESDNPIAAFAADKGLKCFRGSLDDVADRFYQAAAKENWDYAVRINGDNIFMDTLLLRQMTDLANANNYDFISNVKERTFPKGMSVEIVKMSHYAHLLPTISADEGYREHVTQYLYHNEDGGQYHFVMNETLPEAAGIQMALDTPEDFARSEQIIKRFTKEHFHYNLTEIFQLMKEIDGE